MLPKEKWSGEFKKYIEKKIGESIPEKREQTREEMQKNTFKRYLKGLDMKKDDLQDKKILDVGCGEEGEFVKECLESEITNDIHGLDFAVNPGKFGKYSQHFLKGMMQKKIPIKNVDYAVSVGALSLFNTKEEIEKTLPKVINTLKNGGELRIWPIRKAPPEKGLEGIKEARKNWLEVLSNLSSKGKIDYELRPTDIRVAGDNKDVWLEEVLIIKKIGKK